MYIMNRRVVTIVIAMLNLPAGVLVTPAQAQAQAPFPPMPRLLHDDEAQGFSASDFQRALAQLKGERDALDADWKSLTRRLNIHRPTHEPDLEKLQDQLKQTLVRLQQDRLKSNAIPGPGPVLPTQPKPNPLPPEPKTVTADPPQPVPPAVSSSSTAAGPVDIVHFAQTLFRAERYEEALAVFRTVDLKGRKPEERAPIIYLTAECLRHLGKPDEGIALLREVANSRGDEHLAAYAQWQIENVRWQRETQARLQEIRQRILAMEKR
jgi:tetratricopeptide (TPR) repeat protein